MNSTSLRNLPRLACDITCGPSALHCAWNICSGSYECAARRGRGRALEAHPDDVLQLLGGGGDNGKRHMQLVDGNESYGEFSEIVIGTFVGAW
jgi:hypothetical protein